MPETLTGCRVIPVVEIEQAGDAVPTAEAIAAGGIRVLEITLRTAAAFDAIERIRTSLPELTVGAGTVQTPEQASGAISAGAQFAMAPGLNPRIVAKFRSHDIPFVPGILTPGEIENALALDCRLLKLFPAEPAGGVAYLQALAGPFRHRGLRICATGGISLSSMRQYLETPLVWAVGGSWIATRQEITGHQWDRIADRARQTLDRIAGIDGHGQS